MWPFKKKEDEHSAVAVAAAHANMPKVGKWHLDEKVLGEGGYGKVVRAYDYHVNPPVISACKMIDTRRMKKSAIEREVRVNQKLAHRNIAAVLDYVYVEPMAYVFLELCAGGELFERVISAGRMEEATAREFFVQLCQGVQHCHSRGIVHRDLKLENVMLSDKGTLKIIDFGLAAEYEPLGNGSFQLVTLFETCGSKSYAAPEVLSGKGYSGFGADVWSCGICLFAMLAGFFPLDEATSRDWRFQRSAKAVTQGASITHTIYGFYQRPCPLSAEAVALLDGMLCLDPTRRLSLDAVLQGPWVTGQKLGAKVLNGSAPAPVASAAPARLGGAGSMPVAVHGDEGGAACYRSMDHSSHTSSEPQLPSAASAAAALAGECGGAQHSSSRHEAAAGARDHAGAATQQSVREQQQLAAGASTSSEGSEGSRGGELGWQPNSHSHALSALDGMLLDDDAPVYRSLGLGCLVLDSPPLVARQRAFHEYGEYGLNGEEADAALR